MREVDKENETKEDEYGGAHKSNIVSPKHEETIGNEERDHHENDPQKDFGSPPSILDGCSLVLRVLHANERNSDEEMEE